MSEWGVIRFLHRRVLDGGAVYGFRSKFVKVYFTLIFGFWSVVVIVVVGGGFRRQGLLFFCACWVEGLGF